MQVLRDVAETYPNDTISVETSRLAQKMEDVKFSQFTDVEKTLIRFASNWLTANPRGSRSNPRLSRADRNKSLDSAL